MLRGKFITFYGINNIGKSTHARILCERLTKEGYEPVYIKYPVYNMEPSGPYLNKILREGKQEISEEELQIWFTVNRYQFEPTLKKHLMEGKTVIAEDYIGTGIAWGVTKGANEEWLEEMNKYLIRSDLSIMIDGERIIQAAEKDHIHETNDELMQRSRKTHLALAKKYAWHVIKLQPQQADTAKLIWETVRAFWGLD